MKFRMWMAVSAVVLVATVSMAGMTPQEMTTKVVNCPNCKSLANYPELMPNLRPDIFATQNGFVSTFLVADAKTLPLCQKWEAECEAMMGNMAKTSPADIAKTYCPVCVSYGDIMMNKDVRFESFMGSMGRITVASSATKAGVDVLHAHVATMNEMKAIMPAAMAEIMKSAKPKTTASDE